MFPDFCVFEEDTVSRKHCNDQSRDAVAKALFDQVGANKRGNGQGEEVDPPSALFVFAMIFGCERGVFIKNSMMFAQIAFGVMKEFAGKGLDPATNARRLVRRYAVPITRIFPIESHLIIGIPPGMSNPTSEVLRAPCDPITIG